MKIKVTLSFLCVLITNTVFAETALDINTAVRLALEKNLSLERSRMENVSAKRKYECSWNSLIPSLGAGAMAARLMSITGGLPPVFYHGDAGASILLTQSARPVPRLPPDKKAA